MMQAKGFLQVSREPLLGRRNLFCLQNLLYSSNSVVYGSPYWFFYVLWVAKYQTLRTTDLNRIRYEQPQTFNRFYLAPFNLILVRVITLNCQRTELETACGNSTLVLCSQPVWHFLVFSQSGFYKESTR